MPISRRTFAAASSLAALGWALPRAARGDGTPASDAMWKADPSLETMMALAGVPGVSRSVVAAGGAPRVSVVGTADAESKTPLQEATLFEMASLSKPAVAYVALLLADRGLLALDVTLREVLGFSPVPDDTRGDRITLRHVLSHSSGLQNWRFGATDKLTLAFDPGTRFRYSGEGFVLAQRAMERVTKTPFTLLMRRELLEPLGMGDATFLWHEGLAGRVARPHGGRGDPLNPFAPRQARALAKWAAEQRPARDPASLVYADLEAAQATIAPGQPAFPNNLLPNAAASLLATPGAYARFMALLIDDRSAPPALRLGPATRQALATPQVPVAPGLAWGLGVGLEERDGRQLLWHWGDNGGTKNFVVIDPARGRGDVVCTNGSGGLKVAERIMRPDWGALASFIWV